MKPLSKNLFFMLKSRDGYKSLCLSREETKQKMAERPQGLSLLSVVISLLILQYSFADEPAGILDQCKESCERSYPLHTYPKVIFWAYELWRRFMWHCTCVLIDWLLRTLCCSQPCGNLPEKKELQLEILFFTVICFTKTLVITSFLFSILRRSLCLLVNKGVGFPLSPSWKRGCLM